MLAIYCRRFMLILQITLLCLATSGHCDLSYGDKIAFRFLLKNLRMTDLERYGNREYRSFLLKEKKAQLEREQAYLDYVEDVQLKQKPDAHFDDHGRNFRINSDMDPVSISAIADGSWQSANLIQSSNGFEADSAGVAPILNIVASELGIVMTAIYGIRAGKQFKYKKVLKKQLKELETELKFYNNLYDAFPKSKAVISDKTELEGQVIRLRNAVQEESLLFKELMQEVGFNVGLSSTYFAASAIAYWAPATTLYSILGSVSGGVLYGSFLTWVAIRGIKNDWELKERLADRLLELKTNISRIQRKRKNPLRPILLYYETLRKAHLEQYHILLNKVSISKNGFGLGLGGSVFSAGALAVLSEVGLAVGGTMLIASGYGIIAFLAGTLGMTGYGLVKKHSLQRKTKLMFRKHTSFADGFTYSDYKRDKKRRDKLGKLYQNTIVHLNKLGKAHNKAVAEKKSVGLLKHHFMLLRRQADILVDTVVNLETIEARWFRYRLFFELKQRKHRDLYLDMILMIKQLDYKQALDLCKTLKLNVRHFERYKDQRNRLRFLQTELSRGILMG